jgi:hypothetical protein
VKRKSRGLPCAAELTLGFTPPLPGKHSVDDTQLAKELLQLGLPKGAVPRATRVFCFLQPLVFSVGG